MKSSGYGGSGSSSNNNSRRRTRASPRDDEQGTNRGGEWMGTESTEYEWMDDDEDEDDVEEWANASNSYNNYANDIGKTNDVYSVSSSFQDIKEEDEMLYEVIGYSYSIPRIVLFGTLCVFSLGFLVLFCFWLPFLYVRLTCSKCKLSRARFVLIRSDKSQKSPDVSKVFRYKAQGSKFNLRTVGTSSTYVRSGNTEAIFLSPSTSPNSVSPFPSKSPTQGLSSLSSSSSAAAAAAAAASPNGPGSTKKHVNSKKVDIGHRYFLVIMHKEFRYIYSKMHKTFVRVSFETRLPFSELRKLTNVGYTDEEREEKSNLYGENIIHLPRSNTFYLAVTEIFQPFFIFQILSFMLWVAELYYSYAVFVVCVVVFLVTWNVLDIKTELEKVKELVFETSDVNVVRYK